MINRYYQEKKQIRKDLFKWSRQISEYCAFESFVEYLLPADQLYNKNYQGIEIFGFILMFIIIKIYTEHCHQLKQDEMFECNNTILDEELLLSECNSFKHHDFDENCYFDENFMGKLVFIRKKCQSQSVK